jgi:hypothetical protein
MEYRGADIKVVQDINGGKRKWTVELPVGRKRDCVTTLSLPPKRQLIAR